MHIKIFICKIMNYEFEIMNPSYFKNDILAIKSCHVYWPITVGYL